MQHRRQSRRDDDIDGIDQSVQGRSQIGVRLLRECSLPPRGVVLCSCVREYRTPWCSGLVARPRKTFERASVDALVDALHVLGIEARVVDDRNADAVVEIGASRLIVEAKSIVTASSARHVADDVARRGEATIVVADRIADGAKQLFRHANVDFYDRRGDLRILRPPVVIDVSLPTPAAARPRSSGPLSSQVAKEVAITCLLTPDRPHGVREVAAYVDRAPSAVSTAMADLRAEGLLTSAGEPLIPELLHELAARWRRHRVPLADVPRPGNGRVNEQLDLGLDDVAHETGWALTDTVAASSWGMPVVARGDHPPDFYVPSDAHLRRARALLGEATNPDRPACTVAIAPVRLACSKRVDHARTSGQVWPVANHIVVALDLAQDRARGLEILEQWHPEGIVRAW